MSNTNSITVDDGSRRVPILNTDGEEIGAFTFHPTDIGIIRRYDDMMARFDAITEPLEAASGDDGGDIAGAMAEAEARLYEAVNTLFGSDGAAEAFFGRMHPFSPVNGVFYCQQVLEKVGAYISDQFDAETRRMAGRVEKYLEK